MRRSAITTHRHISAKKAWANLEARAERGEKFGFIACLGLLLKTGVLSRARVLELLQENRVTREDLQAFRKSCE